MMTKTARKILDQMADLVRDPESGWVMVPTGMVGVTVRLTRTHQTPDYMRYAWNQDTYDSHTFVTLVAGKVILGTAAAPWVGRRDSEVPFWLAEAILADENDLGQDMTRMLNLRAMRRAGLAGDQS